MCLLRLSFDFDLFISQVTEFCSIRSGTTKFAYTTKIQILRKLQKVSLISFR